MYVREFVTQQLFIVKCVCVCATHIIFPAHLLNEHFIRVHISLGISFQAPTLIIFAFFI